MFSHCDFHFFSKPTFLVIEMIEFCSVFWLTIGDSNKNKCRLSPFEVAMHDHMCIISCFAIRLQMVGSCKNRFAIIYYYLVLI